MELVSANGENSFNPTPKLKSSPSPISFVSFNKVDNNCHYCRDKYTRTLLFQQKYCEKCLLRYINDVTDINAYLDVTICPTNLDAEHKMSREEFIQNIQENGSKILCFKQIFTNSCLYNNRMIEIEKYCKYCKLCRKLVLTCKQFNTFKSCSDCYLISGNIESTSTKKPTQFLYLPWWYYSDVCIACDSKLKLKSDSDCQKYCTYCYLIYTGCRYCLTTNVIFGITDKSQCMKCKRTLRISFNISDIANISSGNTDLDDFLRNSRFNIHNNFQLLKIVNYVKNIAKDINPTDIFRLIHDNYRNNLLGSIMEWIPYSQITNLNKIAAGGFATVYRATWLNIRSDVAIKRFSNSHYMIKYFLNELKSSHYCYKLGHHVLRTYGFTKDPESMDYMLVMKYASGGDLHSFLQENFNDITWNKKLEILCQISNGLETIHNANFTHRDFHSGNILYVKSADSRYQWQIGDLGLSQPVNNTSKNEIYGVIPYIAPEIFNGAIFSKESDVYSISMIMWELTTGCKPFPNVKHDHALIYKILDGARPEITEDTPECFANLMKSCWHPDSKKRPSITKVRKTFGNYSCKYGKYEEQFHQAEENRIELINSKKLGPEFTEKYHSEAIYTTRPLNSLITSSIITFDNKQEYTITATTTTTTTDYISREIEFDINDIKLNNKVLGYISKEYNLNINGQSSNSAIQNFSTIQQQNTSKHLFQLHLSENLLKLF